MISITKVSLGSVGCIVKFLIKGQWSEASHLSQNRFYVEAGGTCTPDSLVVPPDSKTNWKNGQAI